MRCHLREQVSSVAIIEMLCFRFLSFVALCYFCQILEESCNKCSPIVYRWLSSPSFSQCLPGGQRYIAGFVLMDIKPLKQPLEIQLAKASCWFKTLSV
jgi:hypothetical protein